MLLNNIQYPGGLFATIYFSTLHATLSVSIFMLVLLFDINYFLGCRCVQGPSQPTPHLYCTSPLHQGLCCTDGNRPNEKRNRHIGMVCENLYVTQADFHKYEVNDM
jgi:hypothetical protein